MTVKYNTHEETFEAVYKTAPASTTMLTRPNTAVTTGQQKERI